MKLELSWHVFKDEDLSSFSAEAYRAKERMEVMNIIGDSSERRMMAIVLLTASSIFRGDRIVPGLPDSNEATVGVSTPFYCRDRCRSPPRRSEGWVILFPKCTESRGES